MQITIDSKIYLGLVDAVQRALNIERAALEDLKTDYGIKEGREYFHEYYEEMIKSPEWAAIQSNIECYENVLKKI